MKQCPFLNTLILDNQTKFTMETETDKQFLFLDGFISNVYNNLTTSVFRKSKYTGLSLNFTSFTSRI